MAVAERPMATSAINDELVIDLFAALYEGNQERFGTEDGGSVEVGDWWIDVATDHLSGIEFIGVYPIDPRDMKVKWGCIDFDEGEETSRQHAQNVAYLLEYHDIKAWVERSRSKGYHVWVFCKEWLLPEIMRNALLYACEFCDAPTKEINPKQTHLDDGQVGNYVRLPYPAALCNDGPDERRVMIDQDTGMPITVQAFVMDAWDNRCEPSMLEDLAARYKPRPQYKHRAYAPQVNYVIDESYESTDALIEQLSKDARRLFDNGPKDADRSSALVALGGRIARDRTHEPEEIVHVLHKADADWGKYTDRGDADIRIAEIVNKVLTERDALY